MSDFLWVAIALAIGVVIRRVALRRGKMEEDVEAVSANDFLTVLSTIAVLVLAFVLVAAFDSWSSAGDVAGVEADQTVAMARHASFIDGSDGDKIVADLECYALAVEHRDWPAMSRGKASASAAFWLDTLRTHVDAASDADVASELVDAQSEIVGSRRSRLHDALPSVPAEMYLFMLLTVIATVFAFALFTNVGRGAPGHAFLLVVSGLVLAGSLALVHDVDSPYSGYSSIKPSAMHEAQGQIRDELDRRHVSKLQCNSHGIPTKAGFRARDVVIR